MIVAATWDFELETELRRLVHTVKTSAIFRITAVREWGKTKIKTKPFLINLGAST